MAYLSTPKLIFPTKDYRVTGLPFGKKSSHGGVFWGVHLGEDYFASAGTDVYACGRGTVVYAALHAGSQEKGNWGHVIIIRHKSPYSRRVFYSLYGHLGTSFKRIGEKVALGEPIGFIGEGNTPENGFWPAHLHFGIYMGPWKKEVLPGYWKEGEQRTRMEWWINPSEFIVDYEKKE
ncbi:MAG: M23 family metallopeptidase [Candidatus Moranbacteria bacterium]|nr:M23 family metallopeptidase [Candidatus Moranbacteria bacterium]